MADQKLSEIAANAQPLAPTDKVYGISGGAGAAISASALSRSAVENMQEWVATETIQEFTLDTPENLSLAKPSARVYDFSHTDVTVQTAGGITNETFAFGTDDSVRLDYSNLNGTFGGNLTLTPSTTTAALYSDWLNNVSAPTDIIFVGVSSGSVIIQAIIGGGAPTQAFVALPSALGTSPLYVQFSGPDSAKVIQVFEGSTPIAGATLTVDVSTWGQTKLGTYLQTGAQPTDSGTLSVDLASTGFVNLDGVFDSGGVAFPADKQFQAFRLAQDIDSQGLLKDDIVIFGETGDEYIALKQGDQSYDDSAILGSINSIESSLESTAKYFTMTNVQFGSEFDDFLSSIPANPASDSIVYIDGNVSIPNDLSGNFDFDAKRVKFVGLRDDASLNISGSKDFISWYTAENLVLDFVSRPNGSPIADLSVTPWSFGDNVSLHYNIGTEPLFSNSGTTAEIFAGDNFKLGKVASSNTLYHMFEAMTAGQELSINVGDNAIIDHRVWAESTQTAGFGTVNINSSTGLVINLTNGPDALVAQVNSSSELGKESVIDVGSDLPEDSRLLEEVLEQNYIQGVYYVVPAGSTKANLTNTFESLQDAIQAAADHAALWPLRNSTVERIREYNPTIVMKAGTGTASLDGTAITNIGLLESITFSSFAEQDYVRITSTAAFTSSNKLIFKDAVVQTYGDILTATTADSLDLIDSKLIIESGSKISDGTIVGGAVLCYGNCHITQTGNGRLVDTVSTAFNIYVQSGHTFVDENCLSGANQLTARCGSEGNESASLTIHPNQPLLTGGIQKRYFNMPDVDSIGVLNSPLPAMTGSFPRRLQNVLEDLFYTSYVTRDTITISATVEAPFNSGVIPVDTSGGAITLTFDGTNTLDNSTANDFVAEFSGDFSTNSFTIAVAGGLTTSGTLTFTGADSLVRVSKSGTVITTRLLA